MENLNNFMSQFGTGNEALAPSDGIQGLDAFISTFDTMSESYFFYNKTVEIRFDPEPHIYYLVDPELGNLIPLQNVSTVCHIIDKSDALVPWASKMAIEKLLRTVPTYLDVEGWRMLAHISYDEFHEIAIEAKSAHRDKLEDAGAVGKEAHAHIEAYIKAVLAGNKAAAQLIRDTPCSDQRATNAAGAAFAWLDKHNVRLLATEQKVYSKKHQCSGTMDGKAIVDSCSDPTCCFTQFKDRLSILDWKTSNYLYVEYVFQTAAYLGFHLEEFPEELIGDRWVLRLGKDDGEFESWYLPEQEFAEDYAGFLACLKLKKLVGGAKDRQSNYKTTKRTAKKLARDEAKALAKAEEKVAKAEAKAEAKLLKEQEKERIKAEAKIERERIKAEIRNAKSLPQDLPVKVDEPAPDVKEVSSASETQGKTLVLATSSVTEEEPVRRTFTIPTEE